MPFILQFIILKLPSILFFLDVVECVVKWIRRVLHRIHAYVTSMPLGAEYQL